MKKENNSYHYEKILIDLKNDLLKNISTHYTGSIYLSESDPLIKTLEIAAYRELMIRQKIQDLLNASLLSSAQGNDLKKLAELFFDQETISKINNDNEIREKISDFWKNTPYSTTGTRSAYEFYTRKFIPEAKDISISTESNQIIIYVLLQNNFDLSPLEKAEKNLNDPSIRRLTDKIIVKPVEIIEYDIEIAIKLPPYYSEDIKSILSEKVCLKADQLFLIHRNIATINFNKVIYHPDITEYNIHLTKINKNGEIKLNLIELFANKNEAFQRRNTNIKIN